MKTCFMNWCPWGSATLLTLRTQYPGVLKGKTSRRNEWVKSKTWVFFSANFWNQERECNWMSGGNVNQPNDVDSGMIPFLLQKRQLSIIHTAKDSPDRQNLSGKRWHTLLDLKIALVWSISHVFLQSCTVAGEWTEGKPWGLLSSLRTPCLFIPCSEHTLHFYFWMWFCSCPFH